MYVCAHIVPDDLSKRLRQILDLRGWTPYELSQKSGLESDNHVQVILSRGAKRPSALTLYQIARRECLAGVADLRRGHPRRDREAKVLRPPRLERRA